MLFADDTAVARHIVEDGFTAGERLAIYRNTCRSVLTATLRLGYPAVDRLVGREFFDMIAARFIATQPPRRADLDTFGTGFADFIASVPEAAALAYLPDVARFEWGLASAATAPDDSYLDAATLAASCVGGHADLSFRPHASLRLLALDHPADAIADAVLGGDDETLATFDLSAGPIWLAIHRGPTGVWAERLTPGDWQFLRRVCSGESLGSVLESSGCDPVALLADQFVKGRFAAIRFFPGDESPIVEETSP